VLGAARRVLGQDARIGGRREEDLRQTLRRGSAALPAQVVLPARDRHAGALPAAADIPAVRRAAGDAADLR
ncbi:hypothetical protein B8W95_14100, partial [Staphylococcus pasteuri]